MISKTNSAEEAKALIAAEDAVRKRAARQAAKREEVVATQEIVQCVVLPAGHERISMGEHAGGLGEAHYEEGETFSVAMPIALALYKRGFVNFEGARAALDEQKDAQRAKAIADQADAMALRKAVEQAGL